MADFGQSAPPWTLNIILHSLDRGDLTNVKSEMQEGDKTPLTIDKSCTVGMVKQRVALTVGAPEKRCTLRNWGSQGAVCTPQRRPIAACTAQYMSIRLCKGDKDPLGDLTTLKSVTENGAELLLSVLVPTTKKEGLQRGREIGFVEAKQSAHLINEN